MERPDIGPDYIERIHARVVAAYRWPPGYVWRLTMGEALRYLAAHTAALAEDALIVASVLVTAATAPAELQVMLAGMEGRSIPSPIERYGPAIAAEAQQVIDATRAALRRTRGQRDAG